MSSMKDIHQRLEQITQELAQHVEKEEKKAGRPTEYTFTYEKQRDGVGEWSPYIQDVDAHSLTEAFQSFGNMIETFGYKVRNVNYGLWEEMREEEDRIRAHYRERREAKER